LKLIKTSFFSAIITFIRISSGFVAGKLIAVVTGPSGVAAVGAFTNFISIALTFGNGAINNGVVKYVSEYHLELDKQQRLINTSFKISFYCSLGTGTIIFLLAPFLSSWILSDINYTNITRVLGVTIFFYSINTLIISILNGQGNIKKYTLINVIGSIISLLLTAILVLTFKIIGALYSLILSPSIVFFVTIFLLKNSDLISFKNLKSTFDKEIVLKLGHFSLMAIVSALTVPVSQIILRNMLINKLGIDAAGYWQGMMRVSDGYLMLITTSLSTYYLPKLSSLHTASELRREIFNGYKIIIPAVLIGCILIYFLRFLIISILYTSDFVKMENLFLWQLIGDFFKMSAWILAFLLLAKAKTKLYIITEIGFSILFVLLGYLCVEYYGLKGITISFAINYFFYLIVMIYIFRELLIGKKI
jgi:O-antigen/teichoic acid export membrane protein